MPGYPILLAPLFLLSDDPPVLWGRLQAAGFSALSTGVVLLLALRLFGPKTALLAGGVAAVIPDTVAVGVFVLSEAAFCPFMLLQILFWDLGWRTSFASRMTVWGFVAGCAAGAATLVRPSWLMFTPFAASIGICLGPQRRRQFMLLTTMIIGFCCTMLPWWIRNYQVAGRFVPTTLQFGASLYDGISPNATGVSDMRFVPRFFQEQIAADASVSTPPPGLFEERLDKRLSIAAIDWATQNPNSVLRLAITKFARMWSPVPLASEFSSWVIRLAVAFTFIPTTALALAGCIRFARQDWPYALCIMPAIYLTLLHMVFVSSIRYRQPVMFCLIVLAAGFVTCELRKPCREPADDSET